MGSWWQPLPLHRMKGSRRRSNPSRGLWIPWRDFKGVSYQWRTEDYPGHGFREGTQLGLIAQEVEKVLPEVVVHGPDGYKAVDYQKLVPVLIEAVKEQQSPATNEARIDAQGKEIAELRSMLREIMSRAGASGMTIALGE